MRTTPLTRGRCRALLVRTGLLIVALLLAVPVGAQSGAAPGTPVAASRADESAPRVSGPWVVWASEPNRDMASRVPSADVYASNLETGEVLQLSSGQRSARPAVAGRYVVWTEKRGVDRDIYAFDLETREEIAVAVQPGEQDFPGTDGERAVWLDLRAGTTAIYAFSFAERAERLVVDGPNRRRQPVVSGPWIAWAEARATRLLYDVVALNTDTGEEVQVSRHHFAGQPDLTWPWLVYADGTLENADIVGRNLDTGEERRLSSSRAGARGGAVVAGRYVAWVERREGRGEIWGYDLLAQRERPLVTSEDGQLEPHHDGRTLVWTAWVGRGLDVYAASLEALFNR